MTSHLKKERVWDVVAPLGASSLRLSSLTIRQPMDGTSSVRATATDEEGVIDNEVIAATTFGRPTGITQEPETAVNDPDLSYRRDKAMWILIVSVKDDLVTEINEFEDPRDAWNHLQKSYEVRDVTRKLHLKSRLMSLRVTEDGGIE